MSAMAIRPHSELISVSLIDTNIIIDYFKDFTNSAIKAIYTRTRERKHIPLYNGLFAANRRKKPLK